jgi:hypothetical protein
VLLCIAGAVCAEPGLQTGTVSMEEGAYTSSSTSAGMTFRYLRGHGNKVHRPVCGTEDERRVINLNWPAGRYQFAVLLAAITAGKAVSAIGTGDCSVLGNSEAVVGLRLNNS